MNPRLTLRTLNDAQRVLARAYGFESWPKLKAFVDGATIARFTDAVKAGDMTRVRSMLASRPELVGMDRAGNDDAVHDSVTIGSHGIAKANHPQASAICFNSGNSVYIPDSSATTN
jgi:hypothetical protein